MDGDRFTELNEALADLDADGDEESALRAVDLLWEFAEFSEREAGPEAAVEWYAEIARRMRSAPATFSEEHVEEARVHLIGADCELVFALADAGEKRRADSLAAQVIDAHFDDAPDDLAPSMAAVAFRAVNATSATGELDKALSLVERVLTRFGRPDQPGASGTATTALLISGHLLVRLGHVPEALARFELAGAEVDATDDPDLHAEILMSKASALVELGRGEEGMTLVRGLMSELTDKDDPELVPTLAELREWLQNESVRPLLERGWQLAWSVGRGAEAEATAREAIAAGSDEAWGLLGWLLAPDPRRRDEAERALHQALDPRSALHVRAHACLTLGILREVQGDQAEARRLLTLAAEHEEEVASPEARRWLATRRTRRTRMQLLFFWRRVRSHSRPARWFARRFTRAPGLHASR